jgi:bacillithiol synthase
MKFTTEFIGYSQTGYFSKLATDYIAADKKLQPFYEHPVSIEGIKASILKRKQFKTDRKRLYAVMKEQYSNTELSSKQRSNLKQLLNEDTFTITTAHQPNIFTGPLFFIYKILHVVKLAAFLQNEISGNNFVPVYYMGSEDADLDELGHIYINGEKHAWKTKQTGAVGRMKVDKDLLKMIDVIEGQIAVYPFGNEIINKLRRNYTLNTAIEQATFSFVNELFADHGLLILLPDNAGLKNIFAPVIQKELTEQFSHNAVLQTINEFPKEYKTQTGGRDINLFYLKDDKRERIEIKNSKISVLELKIEFDQTGIIKELKDHPERFSPNVILRPVFQETILPDVAFVGGGGELAYWLELKGVFENVNVPFPVLILRNSFLFIQEELQRIISKLRFDIIDIFKSEEELFQQFVKRESSGQLQLDEEKKKLIQIYDDIRNASAKVDITLQQHVLSLQKLSLKKIDKLEKKLLSAEKKKFESSQRQINKLKKHLFPQNSLQERIDNFIPYYAKYGQAFIEEIYMNSLALDQEFSILKT